MTVLQWDQVGERTYETGVDHGVLYIPDNGVYDTGFAWNGLTTVTESPSGAEATPLYADNIKYLNLISIEQFGGTIEAYTYPDEFGQCDGSVSPVAGVQVGQQTRKTFGLCYRTLKGDDIDGNDAGYKLHLVYGATAAPSEKAYATVNETPEAITFSWEFSTIPVPVTGLKPTATLIIDSADVGAAQLAAIEEILYGSVSEDPRLPLPDEVISIMGGVATASNVVVTGDADSVDITGTTANVLFRVEAWDGDNYNVVVGGNWVNEAAAEALVLANGVHRVTLAAASGFYLPVAQQNVFTVNVT